MKLGQLLDWMDAAHPNAYTPEQKTAWVNDLEAILWTQICLQPMSLLRPYIPEEDGRTRLLLPDGWRRVYTAYLGAMIDFANGEYTQYENDMSLYNGYINELGAWYADAFAPAQNPARWVTAGVFEYADLLGEGATVAALPPDGALLCAEYRTEVPGDGKLILTAGEAELGDSVYITNENGKLLYTPGLVLTAGREEKVNLRYDGDEEKDGCVSLRLLVQPPARRNSLHNGVT